MKHIDPAFVTRRAGARRHSVDSMAQSSSFRLSGGCVSSVTAPLSALPFVHAPRVVLRLIGLRTLGLGVSYRWNSPNTIGLPPQLISCDPIVTPTKIELTVPASKAARGEPLSLAGSRGPARAQKSDHRHAPWLLRARRERPRRCAADNANEIPPSHSITSAGRASTDAGSSSPSALQS